MNMLAIKLNKNIDAEKLLNGIQKLVNSSIQSSEKEYMLVVRVQEIVYNDDTSIPKIEYKPLINE